MTTSAAAIVDEQLTAPVVGVDVGGTKIAAALVSADGGLLGPVAEAPTPAREGAQAVLDAIASTGKIRYRMVDERSAVVY